MGRRAISPAPEREEGNCLLYTSYHLTERFGIFLTGGYGGSRYYTQGKTYDKGIIVEGIETCRNAVVLVLEGFYMLVSQIDVYKRQVLCWQQGFIVSYLFFRSAAA